jgi:glycosyltransferase involved in cell wall biosynthesis
LVEHRIGRPFGYSRFGVLHPLLAATKLVRADATLALFEEEGLFVAYLKRIGAPPFDRKRLAVVAVRLTERMAAMLPTERRAIARCLEAVDRLIVYSSNQFEALRAFGVDTDRVRFVPFGIDHRYFRPVAEPATVTSGLVVAAGRDPGRDYATLLEAVRDSDLAVKVMCEPFNLKWLDVPDNVEVAGFLALTDYRRVLSEAAAVVIPTVSLSYPGGQSVLLHAMALGRCCVVTDSPGLRDYVQPEVTALIVPPGRPDALREAIERAVNDVPLRIQIGTAARQAIEDRFTLEHMWAAMTEVLFPLVGPG